MGTNDLGEVVGGWKDGWIAEWNGYKEREANNKHNFSGQRLVAQDIQVVVLLWHLLLLAVCTYSKGYPILFYQARVNAHGRGGEWEPHGKGK